MDDCITNGTPGKYKSLMVNGKSITAHRLIWRIYRGRISSKQFICHKCDNPSCFNINHLYLGDAKTNMKDQIDRKRHPMLKNTHCPSGHLFDEENTKIYRNQRVCKKCVLAKQEKAKEQRKKDKFLKGLASCIRDLTEPMRS